MLNTCTHVCKTRMQVHVYKHTCACCLSLTHTHTHTLVYFYFHNNSHKICKIIVKYLKMRNVNTCSLTK
jgi:hypothetical protein